MVESVRDTFQALGLILRVKFQDQCPLRPTCTDTRHYHANPEAAAREGQGRRQPQGWATDWKPDLVGKNVGH